MMTLRQRELIELAILVAVAAVFGLVTMRLLGDYRRPVREKYEAVVIGQTESEVRERLGSPYREFDSATAPADYYVPGSAGASVRFPIVL